MPDYDDDQFDNQGPKALRDALDKANKALAAANAEKELLSKQVAASNLTQILADKKVPAHIQKWIKQGNVEPNEAAVDKWLSENGADFGWKPGAAEESEGVQPEEASAQAVPAQQSALTAGDREVLTRLQEAVFGNSSGSLPTAADAVKQSVDQVAAELTSGHSTVATSYEEVVRKLADKGNIPIVGDVKY